MAFFVSRNEYSDRLLVLYVALPNKCRPGIISPDQYFGETGALDLQGKRETSLWRKDFRKPRQTCNTRPY